VVKFAKTDDGFYAMLTKKGKNINKKQERLDKR
jgi:hypothetical protein